MFPGYVGVGGRRYASGMSAVPRSEKPVGRFRRMLAEHKPAPKVAVAVARELAGFIWAALQRPVVA